MPAARLLDLRLRLGSRLGDGRSPGLQRLLAARLLRLEHRHARFAQPLLVLRGARFGLGNVGSRLFDGAFGPAAPLLPAP